MSQGSFVARFVTDISGYQGEEAMDPYKGVIINVEDPGLHAKVTRAERLGLPWRIYSWVYPGDGGASVTRAFAAIELLAVDGFDPAPKTPVFLDYEQNGVTPGDLTNALQRQSDGVGVYTYLATVNDVLDIVHAHSVPLWLAYYPYGYQPVEWSESLSTTARSYGAVMHQYTSTGGPDGSSLDVSVVLDDTWFDLQGDDELSAQAEQDIREIKAHLLGNDSFGIKGVEQTTNEIWAELKGAPAFGQLALFDRIKALEPAFDEEGLAKAIVAQMGDGLASKVLDALHERLAK